jgi:hypothetical protein
MDSHAQSKQQEQEAEAAGLQAQADMEDMKMQMAALQALSFRRRLPPPPRLQAPT